MRTGTWQQAVLGHRGDLTTIDWGFVHLIVPDRGSSRDRTGNPTDAERYLDVARRYAQTWQQNAFDGDHYRLTFDGPGTWSLKYNLVWDRFFGFGLFRDSVVRTDLDYYSTVADRYGVPLDSRAPFTKTDWLIWIAAMAQGDERSGYIDALRRFVNETGDRTPFSDWYDTHDGREQSFHNRTVIGGIFMPLLMDGKTSGGAS